MTMTLRLKEARDITKYLEQERQIEDDRFKELCDICLPSRGFWPKDGETKSLIMERGKTNVNPAVALSLGRSAGGMTVGMTPKGQPWFGLEPDDKAVMERRGVRENLGAREKVIGKMLTNGRFYQNIYYCNLELFGLGNMLLFADYSPKTLLRTEACTMGTYCVALDEDGNLDTVTRRLRWRLKVVAERFGKEKLCKTSRQSLKTEPYKMCDIVHVVTTRPNVDNKKIDKLNMPYKSIIYEEDNQGDSEGADVLSESGYHEMPYFFSPFDQVGGSDYGMGVGDYALGHGKQLNETERQKVICLMKIISPPMRKPAGMKSRMDISPGGETEMSKDHSEGAKTLYDIPYQAYSAAAKEIQDISIRISAVTKADLFYDLPAEMRPDDMTLGEYLNRKGERMQQVAPVMSMYEPNVLDKFIERVHGIAERHGLFPEPPEELLQAGDINIVYTSSVAKALRQLGAESSEAFVGKVLDIADRQAALQQQPTALMKINVEQVVDEYASATGVPSGIVIDDDTFKENMEAIAEQQAQEAQDQQAKEAMDSMAKIGGTSKEGTVMEDLIDG